jgi:hypothetical protein
MKILLIKANRVSQLEYFSGLKKYAASLISQIKKEYHLN